MKNADGEICTPVVRFRKPMPDLFEPRQREESRSPVMRRAALAYDA